MRLVIFIFLVLLINVQCIAQDTTFYDVDGQKVAEIQSSEYFEIVIGQDDEKINTIKTFYSTNSNIRSVETSTIKGKNYTKWYPDGQIKSESSYNKHHEPYGRIRTYWPNGTLKRDDTYKRGKLVYGKCYNSSGQEITHFDYYILPQFPGGFDAGYEYLKKNIRKQQCTGKLHFVTISYRIGKDGIVSDVKLVKGICNDINNEALRVFQNMPQWTPAYVDGEPVAKECKMKIGRGLFR